MTTPMGITMKTMSRRNHEVDEYDDGCGYDDDDNNNINIIS